MHTLPLVQRSTVAWVRGISLAGLLFNAVALPAFAAEADLTLVVTAAPAPVVVDQELRFSIDLLNHGPDSAEDVTVEDDNAAAASLSAVEFRDSADLMVDPQILPSLAFAGAAMEFLIEVANTGPALAGGVDVRVGIQELQMASYLSASSSQGPCSSALDTCAGPQCQEVLDQLLEVSCDLGSMAADSTGWVRVTANIDLPAQTHLTVSGDVGARDTADSDSSNNLIEVDVPVVEMPGDGVQVPGGPLTGGGGIGTGCFIQTVLWDRSGGITAR